MAPMVTMLSAAACGPDGGAEVVAGDVEDFWDEGVVGPTTSLFAGDEAGLGELLEVVAEGGLGDAEPFGEVAGADGASVVGGEVADEPNPGGVGESLEQRSEAGCPVRGHEFLAGAGSTGGVGDGGHLVRIDVILTNINKLERLAY